MESYLESKFSQAVRQAGGWAIKMPTPFITGLPDRLCLMPGGVCFFVELKAAGKKPKKIQAYVHGRLRNLGFQVFIIDNSNQIQECFQKTN